MTSHFSNRRAVAAAVRSAQEFLEPPPDLRPSDWAQRNVVIPIGNAVPGPIRFENAPYQREPLDMTADPDCYRVSLMWGAQVGKTLLALCAQGYRIEQNPTSQIMMQPSQGDLTTWLETKFNPLVDANPRLKALIAKPRGRDGVNNQRMKSYPGGFMMFSWAGSPKTMRGRSAPFIVCDETDGYDRADEGDPVELLAQRSATFGDQRLLLDISTPTFKGASRIEAAFLAGDQRRFHVACPYCGHHQTLRWERVRWDKADDGTDLPETARYHCDNHDPETGEVFCHARWTDGERVSAIRQAEALGAGWKAAKPFRGHASYHLNELYSCFRKLREIVQSFLDKRAANDLQSFINISLAETWEEQGEQVEAEGLAARAEVFAAPVPAGAVVLTAGIDMQMDRLELEVVGWGPGEESWSVDYRVLWGDPLQGDVWDDLDAVLSETWLHESGAQMAISAACLDTGGTAGMTQAAYEYARGKTGRRLFAIKGVPGWGRPIVSSPSRKASGKRARKVDLFGVGVDEAKVVVTRRLGIQQPGPGYCHFPNDRDAEYFAQITAEKLVTRSVRGFGIREWHKTRERNEAFDCRVYATAALKLLNPNIGRLAKKFGVPPVDGSRQDVTETLTAALPEIAPEETHAPPMQASSRPAKRLAHAAGWLDEWMVRRGVALLIPDEFVAGTTLDIRLSLTAFPAPAWQLAWILRGPAAISVLAEAYGLQHRLGASAEVTRDWTPGNYVWSLRAMRAGDVVQIETGNMRLRPDISLIPAGHDGRSHAARVLDAIEAVLENRATMDQQKYAINNRELWRTPIPELLLLRDRYRAELRREQQAARRGQSLLGRQVKVRF